MSSVSKEELKNLKKLIANIEELIKLNIDFQRDEMADPVLMLLQIY